ncbi:hypothetical protein DMJ13_22970 [halophilic archaeon]|nr:hypothetical protein DMJ13_22970 [halophilic archaeon]
MSDDLTKEELRAQTERGSRLDTEKQKQDEDTLSNAILAELDNIDSGEKAKTLSVRDGNLAVILYALEERDEMAEIGTQLQKELGRPLDSDAVTRSAVLAMAARIGLQEAAPEVVEAAKEAQKERVSQRF